MGWTYQQKPENVTEWFKNKLTWENDTRKYTCLATAIKFKEAYAAIEVIYKDTGKRQVFAAAFMLNYTREYHYNFGYKDMTEDMGPVIANCPKKILDLLTEPENEWAAQWRERCRAKLNRPKIKIGDTIKFDEHIRFAGSMAKTFEKVKYGRKRNIFKAIDGFGQLVRLTKGTLDNCKWEFV